MVKILLFVSLMICGAMALPADYFDRVVPWRRPIRDVVREERILDPKFFTTWRMNPHIREFAHERMMEIRDREVPRIVERLREPELERIVDPYVVPPYVVAPYVVDPYIVDRFPTLEHVERVRERLRDPIVREIETVPRYLEPEFPRDFKYPLEKILF